MQSVWWPLVRGMVDAGKVEAFGWAGPHACSFRDACWLVMSLALELPPLGSLVLRGEPASQARLHCYDVAWAMFTLRGMAQTKSTELSS